MAAIDDATKINGNKYFSVQNADGSWTDPLAGQAIYSRTFVPKDKPVEQYDSTSEVVAKIVDENKFDIPALPDEGEIIKDKLYKWEGIVVRCRQTHQRTIYDPTETLALFTVYRKETADMGWIAGEKVDVGTVRVFKEVTYEAIQAHVTQEDWTPDKTTSLWRVVEDTGGDEYPVFVQPTGAHNVYMKDEIVWYPKADTTLYISTINNNSWAPGVYGWKKYTP